MIRLAKEEEEIAMMVEPGLVADIDLANIVSDYASTLFFFGVDPQGHSFDRAEEGIAAINAETRQGAREFMRLKVAVLQQKREIALLLRDNPSADI
jgi:hypothetical protein